jgi:hypothetical protein
MPLRTGWMQNRAVFAAMERKAILVPQWPLKPVGKNSEYVAKRTNGSG